MSYKNFKSMLEGKDKLDVYTDILRFVNYLSTISNDIRLLEFEELDVVVRREVAAETMENVRASLGVLIGLEMNAPFGETSGLGLKAEEYVQSLLDEEFSLADCVETLVSATLQSFTDHEEDPVCVEELIGKDPEQYQEWSLSIYDSVVRIKVIIDYFQARI